MRRLRRGGERIRSARQTLEDDPRRCPLLEPLLPALTRAVLHWGAVHPSLVVMHDEQSALTPWRVADIAALVITVGAYWKMDSPQDAYWMMFLMGAAQLSLFAGFAIYLPEIFPSRLRSTGISFCYNLGRFAAAGGSFFSAVLTQQVFAGFDAPLPYRYSAMTMCAIFLIGLIVLPFAPETKGKPLPEDTAPPAYSKEDLELAGAK